MPAIATTVTLKQLLASASARAPETGIASVVRLPSRAIVLADDDTGEGAATTWIQVLRVGKFWSPRYKDFSVTKSTLSTMVENFQTITPKAPTELPLDYNHGTSRPDTVEQGKAAGWIKDVELRADGKELWAQVELTPEAADLVRNKEYRYVSATFDFDYVHTQDGNRKKSIGPTLMAAALTNTPFVEGMAPVSLSAQASVELAEDEAAEATFSFGEIRRRVQEQLTERLKAPGCCGAYLVDLFDGFLIYRADYDGDTFRIDYRIASDGAVTFTSDPVEVRVAYEPLPGATEMANLKVKDAAGNEIELTEETVVALAKAHGPKSGDPAMLARLDELETKFTKSEADIVELSAKNLALETEKQEMNAKAKVDALIRAGKIPAKKRAEYVKVAMKDRETFTALTADLPTLYHIDKEFGSAEDAEMVSATQEVLALARSMQDKDSKLSLSDAITRVSQQRPDLYERYSRESAVKV